MKNKKLVSILASIAMLSIGLTGCSAVNENHNAMSQTTSHASKEVGGLTSEKQYKELANLNYESDSNVVIFVNSNNSTLNKKNWKHSEILYQNLDYLNRASSPTTAYLDKSNIANTSYRVRQTVKPTGWHSNRPGAEIYNRGHLIAYSLSGGINKWGKYTGGKKVGDQNNPKNLFTQTAYANQNVQTYYESQVREALMSGQKVIYQATPIFRGSEKLARGVNLQAVSTDGMLNFNVYIFNVQPGYKFDYQTGRAIKDNSMKVKFYQ